MKNINTYIIEKFKISKDIEIPDDIYDKYNVGDNCLLFIHYNNRKGKSYHLIDAVQIEKINKKSIRLKYLTKTSEQNKSIISKPFIPDDEQFEKYLYYTKSFNINMLLIPKDDALKILKTIEKYRGRISWYSIIKEKELHTGEFVNTKGEFGYLHIISLDDLFKIRNTLEKGS